MSDWCALCSCDGPLKSFPDDKNFDCPLLGKKICETCCTAELMGGMGAPDTVKQACEMTRKTPQEVHRTCLTCPHGGPGVGELGELVYEDPNKREENRQFQEQWAEKLKWLRNEAGENYPTNLLP